MPLTVIRRRVIWYTRIKHRQRYILHIQQSVHIDKKIEWSGVLGSEKKTKIKL